MAPVLIVCPDSTLKFYDSALAWKYLESLRKVPIKLADLTSTVSESEFAMEKTVELDPSLDVYSRRSSEEDPSVSESKLKVDLDIGIDTIFLQMSVKSLSPLGLTVKTR